MAVGRPISLTPNIATKTLSSTATADQTSFTVTGGYRINELGVYRNGVRLVQGKDFTASDGSTVTLLSGATVGDIIEFVIFDSFNIADAIKTVGDQTLSGELTATKFIGDGSALTGVGDTAYIDAASLTVAGIATAKSGVNITGGELTVGSGITMGIAGVATFSGTADVHLLDGVKLNVGDSNDLQIYHDPGHGFIDNNTGHLYIRNQADGGDDDGDIYIQAKNGESSINAKDDGTVELFFDNSKKLETTTDGITVSGEATATAGVNVSGGEITVGSGITMASTAGVVTFADGGASSNALHFGSRGDFQIYHNGSYNYIVGDSSNPAHIYIRPNHAEEAVCIENNGACKFAYDGSYKFQTNNDGTSTTGISTADDFTIGVGGTSVHTALGTKASTGKAIAMAMVFG